MNTTTIYIIIALTAFIVGVIACELLSTPVKNALQYNSTTDGHKLQPDKYAVSLTSTDDTSSALLADKAKCIARTLGGVAYSVGANSDGYALVRVATADSCTSDDVSDCLVADATATSYIK